MILATYTTRSCDAQCAWYWISEELKEGLDIVLDVDMLYPVGTP